MCLKRVVAEGWIFFFRPIPEDQSIKHSSHRTTKKSWQLTSSTSWFFSFLSLRTTLASKWGLWRDVTCRRASQAIVSVAAVWGCLVGLSVSQSIICFKSTQDFVRNFPVQKWQHILLPALLVYISGKTYFIEQKAYRNDGFFTFRGSNPRGSHPIQTSTTTCNSYTRNVDSEHNTCQRDSIIGLWKQPCFSYITYNETSFRGW